ncbi:hypothetical protein FQN53_006060 [Emmonsiellopsis sp. PD_33]|nr:hypothetical protein FQN53_006060 [Emmonsiellopsis sp. PD_33]
MLLDSCFLKASLWLFLQAALLPKASAAKCYARDGTEQTASEYQPCFPDQEHSACCSLSKSNNLIGDICTSEGLCLAQVSPHTGAYYENGCTDESWLSPSCPGFCAGVSSDGGIRVLQCPDKGLDHWCCSTNNRNCCDDSFRVNIGSFMFPKSSSSPEPSSTSPTSSTGTAGTTTAAGTGTCQETGQAAASECPVASKSNTAATAGVGAALGASLGAALIGLFFQRRRYQKKLHTLQTGGINYSGYKHPGSAGPVAPPVELPQSGKTEAYEIDGHHR